ncbi:uncharacterized protein LOC129759348 isoform X2 [Uranotaenia lowii]|uniref:uncharacterized protein LOC129759348 isoform X2 n=1 Tax=Uranotaenia lowii TaxID=190385 RepID=UPI002479E83D|nr:uncharacterized protein LOC129759348 isoform X2 [Uranotaenia lowii]
MASGRARLPPTPQTANGTASGGGSGSRPLVEMHTNNNTYAAGADKSNSESSIQDMAASQMLENLTDQERQIILNVLNRDENVRQADAARIMLLRAELFNLRKKGNVKALLGGSLDRPTYIESSRSCSRCGIELGRIINRGAPCRSCRLRVCKGCREFSTRTTDWVCVVCHKQIEIQAASENWMSDYTDSEARRTSVITNTNFLPASDLIKKSIRRSWTISNAEDDNRQTGADDDQQQYSHLPRKQSQSSYPSLVRYPYINPCTMAEYVQEDEFDNEIHPPIGRRMPRQSTLPNPEAGMYYGSNNNLMPPSVSPKQLSPSPQYSPYHTDNENDEADTPQKQTSPLPARYQIRRQSTLPCRPNETHDIGPKLLSTSPNSRTNLYSRSPDKSDSDLPPRYPPFAHSQQQPLQSGQQRQLPTSPNRMLFNKSPDSGAESAGDGIISGNSSSILRRFQMTRQATLPNPEQHVKLLPTSPPKKQLSPHSIKRSPEFARQNTLPAPDSMNSLSVHQHGPKFMPISPRQKQSFLFPQPAPAPRPFLSQQHFPTIADELSTTPQQNPSTPSGSVGGTGITGGPQHASKMIKVRSHSNEEYSLNRGPHASIINAGVPSEGRRMLPEIPSNRSPRLVRQEHVREDSVNSEKRSPKQKTFAEAKQSMMDDYDPTCDSTNQLNFNEDEEISYYNSEDNYDTRLYSVESFPNDGTSEYPYTEDYLKHGGSIKRDSTRLRRRKSRDLPAQPEPVASSNDDEPVKRKPETMRSISEESPGNKSIKPTPRRSLSHPEKDTQYMQSFRKPEITTKIPSPRPLAEILERAQKSIKLPSPRRKAFKSMDQACESEINARSTLNVQTDSGAGSNTINASSEGTAPGVRTGPRKISAFQQILQNQRLQKRDSKSLDIVASKLMEEKYGGFAETEDDKSKSLDDGIFCSDKNSDDNSSDEQINLINKHKTHLGEQEIKHAVEAAAVVFKKVVLQRREEKRTKDEGDFGVKPKHSSAATIYHNSPGVQRKYYDDLTTLSSPSESDNQLAKLAFNDFVDDYRLVFISSDSSSKEEEYDSSSTTSSVYTKCSIALDDCDWDYFEPEINTSATKTLLYDITNSNSSSRGNISRKRSLLSSPLTSPMFCRRKRNSINTLYKCDAETDDEFMKQVESSSSSTRSERFLENLDDDLNGRKISKCHCGLETQYVAIPVPVPIPVPISTYHDLSHKQLDTMLQQQTQTDLIKQLWHNATGNEAAFFQFTCNKDSCTHSCSNCQNQVKNMKTHQHNMTNNIENNCSENTNGVVENITSIRSKNNSKAYGAKQYRYAENESGFGFINSNSSIAASACNEKLFCNNDSPGSARKCKPISVDSVKPTVAVSTSKELVDSLANNFSYRQLQNMDSRIESCHGMIEHLDVNPDRTDSSDSGENNNDGVTRTEGMEKSKQLCEKPRINKRSPMVVHQRRSHETIKSEQPLTYVQVQNSSGVSESVISVKQEEKDKSHEEERSVKNNENKIQYAKEELKNLPSNDCTYGIESCNTYKKSTTAHNVSLCDEATLVLEWSTEQKVINRATNSNDTWPDDDSAYQFTDNESMTTVKELKPVESVDLDGELKGYLLSESYFSSSQSSLASSENENSSNRVLPNSTSQRCYEVNNEPVLLRIKHTSSSNENSDFSTSCSSIESDSDDTGTIADRRPKSKTFSKVMVVNVDFNDSNDSDISSTTSSNAFMLQNCDSEMNANISTNQLENDGIVLKQIIHIDSDDEIRQTTELDESISAKGQLKQTPSKTEGEIDHLTESSEAFGENSEILKAKKPTANIECNKNDRSMGDVSTKQHSFCEYGNIESPEVPVAQQNLCKVLEQTSNTLTSSGIHNQSKVNENKRSDAHDENPRKNIAEEIPQLPLPTPPATSMPTMHDLTVNTTLNTVVNERSSNADVNSSFVAATNAANNRYKSLILIGSENGTISMATESSSETPPTADVADHGLPHHVNIVTSNTTRIVNSSDDDDHHQQQQQQQHPPTSVTVKHTSWISKAMHGDEEDDYGDDVVPLALDNEPDRSLDRGLANYFNFSLEQASPQTSRRPVRITTNESAITNNVVLESVASVNDVDSAQHCNDEGKNRPPIEGQTSDSVKVSSESSEMINSGSAGLAECTSGRSSRNSNSSDSYNNSANNEDVTVVTGANTLSAVICLEDGLADDDSWVEEVSQDEEEFATTTATESDIDDSGEEISLGVVDREEELRGYHRAAIDFTLHTIVEESCEDSEVESNRTSGCSKQKNRVSASELEKYFFFGLGDGASGAISQNIRDDSISESSSVCSEGLDSLGGPEESLGTSAESADLASSRLEKYFLTGFMGFTTEQNESDGSGSVGSDSEGHPSPEQRRKRLVRARGAGRSQSSSLDNLLAKESDFEQQQGDLHECQDSSETDTCDETIAQADKNESSHEAAAKRKKKYAKKVEVDEARKQSELIEFHRQDNSDDGGRQTPKVDLPLTNPLSESKKQNSRDSGFIGSNDDLLKEGETVRSPELKNELEEIVEENKIDLKDENTSPKTASNIDQPAVHLSRKDSFNNWSSDEETNLMMSKMRQFFKTLVAASANSRAASRNSTPVVSEANTPKHGTPVPKTHHHRNKPPQLVYFENELTRLMKTVPGIRDEQVREIVEYLSSEDTWSDSYDSSDYTSSDLEGAVSQKSVLQQQISASCQQIINKFDNLEKDEEGDMGDGGLIEEPHALNKETAFVYQRLVASLNKMAKDEEKPVNATSSPPLIAKVMHHIGSRLVALMHEVSSGESHTSASPKSTGLRYHTRKVQPNISVTTTEDDDSTSECNMEKNEDLGYLLPRSKSHDLLLGDAKPHHHQSSIIGGEMVAEEKEASDYERFSWRGSFESALLANGDSRSKLSMLDNSTSSISVLAAKRRSAGDLLFNNQNLSREQLDRVRSCGSIGGEREDFESSKLWGSSQSQKTGRRRSSVADDTDSDDSTRNENRLASRSTLPRSLQNGNSSINTNSLPRLPTSNMQTIMQSVPNESASTSSVMQKSQSVYHFLQNNVKSARYRAPGFNQRPPSAPKRAVSAPGLQQPPYPRRERRKVQSFLNGEFYFFHH